MENEEILREFARWENVIEKERASRMLESSEETKRRVAETRRKWQSL